MVQAYEAMLIEMGIYGNIFECDFDTYGCLTTDGTWWKNFWEFAHTLKTTFSLAEEHQLQPI